jgi:hypothetical protein
MFNTPKKKKISMLNKRTMQKLGEFEAFTWNYFGYGCIEFDKWPDGELLFLTCVVEQTLEKLASVSVKSMEKLETQNKGLGFTPYGGVR